MERRLPLMNAMRPEDSFIFGEKDGTRIDKGVLLNEDYLKTIEEQLAYKMEYYSAYPDLFLDEISPDADDLRLFFYQRILLRALMRFKEVYWVACLHPNTPILTEDGMVPIKDYDISRKVWTKDGWKLPLNKSARTHYGKFLRIDGAGCIEDNMIVTDNHKFLCYSKNEIHSRPGIFWEDSLKEIFNVTDYNERKEFYRVNLREYEPIWKEARDLNPKTDYLISPIDVETKPIKMIKVPPVPNKHCTSIIQREYIEINEEFYEWLGIWLAEGSWNQRHISFTININEDRLKDRIINLTELIFGLTPICMIRDNNSQVLQINSSHLDAFFSQLFNCKYNEINQWNKCIPSCLLHDTPSKQLQLLKGWLDGDGYYHAPRGYGRYKGTTVSNILVEGMKHICYRNYINPSITIENRENKAKVYNLNINGLIADELKNAINENRIVQITNKMRHGDDFPRKANNYLYMINRIQEIQEIVPEEKEVYCLEMEAPCESFCTNGVESHNCRATSKTFLSILALILQCIFMPGTKRFIVATYKVQAAKIAKEKISEIFQHWPLLRREIIGGDVMELPGNYGKDYVTLKFRNGSQLDVVGGDGTRGLRRMGGLLDELRDKMSEFCICSLMKVYL